jgi:hypothetical protein
VVVKIVGSGTKSGSLLPDDLDWRNKTWDPFLFVQHALSGVVKILYLLYFGESAAGRNLFLC